MKWGMLAMPSKTSWFNKEAFIQDFRSVGWIGLLSLIALFFILPVRLLFEFTTKPINTQDYFISNLNDVLFINFPLQIMLFYVIPVLLSIFLFRYLHVKQQADMIHSFPIKRERLFFHRILSGLFLLYTPILINAFIVLLIIQTLGIQDYLSYGQVFEWLGIVMLFEGLMFFAGVLIAMLTGISAVQGILTYIFLFFPLGFSILLIYNLKQIFHGFPANYYLKEEVMYLSPISRLPMLIEEPIYFIEVIIYILLSIAFCFLSLWLYKKRNIEAASQAIAFPQLKPIFKYGVTFCFMLLGGLYFVEFEEAASSFWIYFGYISFSLIGYLIAEMILQKSWRVFSSLKGYVIYGLVTGLLLVVFHFDLTGYEKKQPPLSEIESIYYGPYYNPEFVDDPKEYDLNVYHDSRNIEAIYNIHQYLSSNKQPFDNNYGYERVTIIYNLKNGDQIIREYSIYDKKSMEEWYNQIYSSEEYKLKYFEILNIEPENVDKITISASHFKNKQTFITKPEDIIEAVNILQSEARNADFETLNDQREPWGSINLTLSNGDTIHETWYKKYDQFTEWLKQKEMFADATISSEDVTKVYIAKQRDLERIQEERLGYHKIFERAEEYDFILKVEDKSQIEEVLENVSMYREGEYVVAIYYDFEEGFYELRGFTDQYIPDFVKNQLD